MRRYVLLVLGAIAWGLLVFGVALNVHFPEEALLKRLRWEVQNATNGATLLKASGASPWRMSGVTLSDVQVYQGKANSRRGRQANNDDPPKLMLVASAASVRVEPLALLQGEQAARFAANLYDGDVTGRFAQSSEMVDVQILGEGLNLALVPIAGDTWSVDAGGRLNLDVDMQLNQEKIKNSDGSITLTIDDFVINGGEAMGFTFDEAADFSKAILELKARNGKLEVEEGEFISELVEIFIEGDVTLGKTLRRTRLNLKLRIKVADKWDALLKNVPQAKNARDDDGYYNMTVSGTAQNPRFREQRANRARTNRNRNRNRANRDDTPRMTPRERFLERRRQEEANMTPEERAEREKRDEERMQRLRERMDRSRVERDIDQPPVQIGGRQIDAPPDRIQRDFDDEPLDDELFDDEDEEFIEDEDFRDDPERDDFE